MILRRVRIAAVERVGSGFRRLLLDGDVPAPRAGTKLQLLLPSDDMRTYSPVPASDGIALLGWIHAGGPGARWFNEMQAGDEIRFTGPQRSLDLPAGPVILVGDETSVALAAAFESERPGSVHAVFQAGSVDDVRVAADAMGLRRVAAVPRGAHDDVVDAIMAAHAASPDATVALTGGAELVVATRASLRERGIRVKTRPYWVPGRAGLD